MSATALVRSAEKLKTLESTARNALRAVRELERVKTADLFGRYDIYAGEKFDDELQDDLAALVKLAMAEYPGRHVEVIVLVHVGEERQPTAVVSNGNKS